METNLPRTCNLKFEDPNKLYKFFCTIQPDDGYWKGGKFKFILEIPEEYNIVVSNVEFWCHAALGYLID